VQPLFWTLPTGYLGGAAAAGGIALINSIGNLGGFVAPNLKGIAEHLAGSSQAGMLSLSAVGLIGAVLLLTFRMTPESTASLSHRPVPLGERPGH
jgi:nitrate/nitrite transporter NarK